MSTGQTAMKPNYLGKLLKDSSPGAQAVYQRLKAPFVLSRASCRGRWELWILPATGLQAGFLGADKICSCPHLSTSGSFCFSTRRHKHQQNPIITSPFVFTFLIGLVGIFFSFLICIVCINFGGEKKKPEAILWLIGSATWFFGSEQSF